MNRRPQWKLVDMTTVRNGDRVYALAHVRDLRTREVCTWWSIGTDRMGLEAEREQRRQLYDRVDRENNRDLLVEAAEELGDILRPYQGSRRYSNIRADGCPWGDPEPPVRGPRLSRARGRRK